MNTEINYFDKLSNNKIVPTRKEKIILSILIIAGLAIFGWFKFVLADNQFSTDYETIVAEVETYKKEKSEIMAYLSGQISAELISEIEDEESITQEKINALFDYYTVHKKLVGGKKKLSDYLEKGHQLLGK